MFSVDRKYGKKRKYKENLNYHQRTKNLSFAGGDFHDAVTTKRLSGKSCFRAKS